MSEHTPGPWMVEARTTSGYVITPNRIVGYCIAIVPQTSRRSDQQIGTNARLIATSPDMLAELIQARNYVAVVAKRTTDEKVHADLKSIDAVIAKATGAAS